jgi:[acyl-carrier-protein] S-malonyltransferase
MGKEMAAAYPIAKETFDEADATLGVRLSTLCFEGPQETLTDTVNAQPALYVAGVAAWRALLTLVGEDFRPAYVAGHSLGEFTALTAAGALDYADGLKLVRRRGELMRDAGELSPGGMAALLGLDAEAVAALCEEVAADTGGVLVVANDNCPGQLVIAGEEASLEEALGRAKDKGAKRAVRLPVSIAAHSPLMERAAADFREAVAATTFIDPHTPIIGNVSAAPLTDADAIRDELNAQLTSPVRWTESVQAMLANGANTFLELGSKDVLSGLLRRIDRSTTRIMIDEPEGFATLGA